MPERCDRRCSIVTPSSIRGRSRPSTERAVVESSSRPSSIKADDRQRRQALRTARCPELGIDLIRDPEATVR